LTNKSAPHLAAVIYINNKEVGPTVLLEQILVGNTGIQVDPTLPTSYLVDNMHQALLIYKLTSSD